MIELLLILALMLIAARVASGIYNHRSMWRWIVAYWLTLTFKNLVDLIGRIK